MNLPFINPDTESKNEKNRGLTAFLEPLSPPSEEYVEIFTFLKY